MTRFASRALVCAVALVAGACGARDPYCNGDHPPVATQVAVALFDGAGEPLCRTDATITASQPAAVNPVSSSEFELSDRAIAELRLDGHFDQIPSGTACNFWVAGVIAGPAFEDRWEYCGAPIVVDVQVAGCPAVRVVWSWDDNTYDGRIGINWEVPVEVDCEPSL